jgi:AcrR family transcriptional regulator
MADEGGIESLSMRKLGQRLSVEAMSIYNHVANKEDLIYGMLDMVDAEIEIPLPGDEWRNAVRRFAISAHDAMLGHRWSCALTLSTGPKRMRHARLQYMEGLLGTLRSDGFSPDMTHHAYQAIESNIMGFTLWQVSIAQHLTNAEAPNIAKLLFSQIPEDKFPFSIEHGRQHFSGSAPSGNEEFAFGLDLVLDGLERLRESGAG